MSTTGRGRGDDEDGAPAAPPIPSFASLRAPRRTRAALDVLLPPAAELPRAAVEAPVVERPPVVDRRVRPAAPVPATPRPAEWPDLLHFGVRVATTALRRLRRLLGE